MAGSAFTPATWSAQSRSRRTCATRTDAERNACGTGEQSRRSEHALPKTGPDLPSGFHCWPTLFGKVSLGSREVFRRGRAEVRFALQVQNFGLDRPPAVRRHL